VYRPTVGVALGSGGAKGFAHVGVLKALEENGISPSVVAGSSMGSLVGAFYATGMRPDFMERLACTMSWRHWIDLTVPKVGLISGEKIRQMLTVLTRGSKIEDANRRLAIVATELTQRKRVVFTSGLIADAVRASISIPGIFVPYVTPDGVFVDGGVIDRVPVDVAKQLGADVIIAVDVATVQKSSVPENMMDVIMQSLDIMQQHSVDFRSPHASLYIEPDVSHVGTSQFHRAKDAIVAGYEATIEKMEDIKRVVSCTEAETS
jgi:NTE family protein